MLIDAEIFRSRYHEGVRELSSFEWPHLEILLEILREIIMQQHTERSARRHIMITGCAGFLGKATAREIIAKGESIIGLYHQKLPESLDRMMPLCADLKTPEALLAPLRSVDTVIHLAWSGGVLGSESLRSTNPTRERMFSSGNVAMTLNLVRSMERQGVKRIVFVSWIGASDHCDKLVLREKYWAENIILNSRIPEKIVVRSGVAIDPDDKGSDFAIATQRLTKMPLFTPLPSLASDVVFTARRDLVDRITKLATSSEPYIGPVIEDLASTAPITSSDAIANFTSKWWGQRKFMLKGFLGRHLFALVDGEFGRLPKDAPKVSDYLVLSRGSNLINQTPAAF